MAHTVAEALGIMRTGNVFNLECCSADAKQEIGGYYNTFTGATVPVKHRRNLGVESPLVQFNLPTKAPNHLKNGTINIKVPGKTHPVKVHIYLILKLNGQDVI